MGMISAPFPAMPGHHEQALVAAVQAGLPLVPRPFAAIADRIGLTEAEVIGRLRDLRDRGVFKRLGVVVRHRELGYDANAMVVWDIPDVQVSKLGTCLARFPFVTLCYRRPRRPPVWPYNLFTMIHGRDRNQVLARISELVDSCALDAVPHLALFSRRRFKQCGARYQPPCVHTTEHPR